MQAQTILNHAARHAHDHDISLIEGQWEAIQESIEHAVLNNKPITISHTYINEHTIKCLRYSGFKLGEDSWSNYKYVPHRFVELIQY